RAASVPELCPVAGAGGRVRGRCGAGTPGRDSGREARQSAGLKVAQAS
nr:hypothetical protein [Tanacetum cinerariifolium]